MKNKKHLTLDERIEIQKGLDYGVSFKSIGKRIGKHETTVSREVKNIFACKRLLLSKLTRTEMP